MRRTVWAVASLVALAACSGNSEPVGENSAGSIKTTAVGNIVAAEPSPTPTPTTADNAATMSNDAASSIDAMAGNMAGE